MFNSSGRGCSFRRATYMTDEGPANAKLLTLRSDVDCTYGCVYTEHVAFEVPEVVLSALASWSADRPVQPWRFRFHAKNELDWTDSIAPAEAAGLLIAVRRYRILRGLPEQKE